MKDADNIKGAGTKDKAPQNGHGREDKGSFRVVDRRHHASGHAASESQATATDQPEPGVPADGQAVPVGAQAAPPENPQTKTEEEVVHLRSRVDELARAYARALEDQKDFRLRLTRENERVIASEKVEVVRALIESVDDLDRSLGAADPSPLAAGVRVIRDSIVKRLATMGVERMSLIGKRFDPNLSEAIGLVEVADPSLLDGVVEELAAGYRMGDRVVRPAKVRVGCAPTASA